MNLIALNGEFVELESARVPATDAGFLLGDGVFETIRVEGGQLLGAADHFARLARGVRVLEIPYKVDSEHLLALSHQVLDANGRTEARLRITVTRGALRGNPIAESEGEPTEVIAAAPLPPDPLEDGRTGWSALLAPNPRNERSPAAAIKCTSYIESLLARRVAQRAEFDEAIVLNTRGTIAEASMANLFLVSGGELRTPPVEDGALPGTMRARVLRAARRLEIPTHEETLSVEELFAADEVFLTNAMIQIVPLERLGERMLSVPEAKRSVAQRLLHAIRQEVEAWLREGRLT